MGQRRVLIHVLDGDCVVSGDVEIFIVIPWSLHQMVRMLIDYQQLSLPKSVISI